MHIRQNSTFCSNFVFIPFRKWKAERASLKQMADEEKNQIVNKNNLRERI